MAPIVVHSQCVYLYIDGWVADDDNKLLEFMFDAKVRSVAKGKVEDFSEEFVVEAQQELGEEFKSPKDLGEVEARVKFLRKRFNTFTYVINHPGTTWDPADGYVWASDKT